MNLWIKKALTFIKPITTAIKGITYFLSALLLICNFIRTHSTNIGVYVLNNLELLFVLLMLIGLSMWLAKKLKNTNLQIGNLTKHNSELSTHNTELTKKADELQAIINNKPKLEFIFDIEWDVAKQIPYCKKCHSHMDFHTPYYENLSPHFLCRNRQCRYIPILEKDNRLSPLDLIEKIKLLADSRLPQ